MSRGTDFVWKGEKNRRLGVYRACSCAVCSKNRKGVGFISFSGASGRGFTIWIEHEEVFRELREALDHLKKSL